MDTFATDPLSLNGMVAVESQSGACEYASVEVGMDTVRLLSHGSLSGSLVIG